MPRPDWIDGSLYPDTEEPPAELKTLSALRMPIWSMSDHRGTGRRVLDFALFIRERQLAWGWDAISDEQAAALKAEFAAEDVDFAEAAVADYLTLLKREDKA